MIFKDVDGFVPSYKEDELVAYGGYHEGFADGVLFVMALLNDLPTIRIENCENCKHRYTEFCPKFTMVVQQNCDGSIETDYVDETYNSFFCAYGEKEG